MSGVESDFALDRLDGSVRSQELKILRVLLLPIMGVLIVVAYGSVQLLSWYASWEEL